MQKKFIKSSIDVQQKARIDSPTEKNLITKSDGH